MKNILKLSLVFVAATFFLTACNKEKAAVAKIEGLWTLDSSRSEEHNV